MDTRTNAISIETVLEGYFGTFIDEVAAGNASNKKARFNHLLQSFRSEPNYKKHPKECEAALLQFLCKIDLDKIAKIRKMTSPNYGRESAKLIAETILEMMNNLHGKGLIFDDKESATVIKQKLEIAANIKKYAKFVSGEKFSGLIKASNVYEEVKQIVDSRSKFLALSKRSKSLTSLKQTQHNGQTLFTSPSAGQIQSIPKPEEEKSFASPSLRGSGSQGE